MAVRGISVLLEEILSDTNAGHVFAGATLPFGTANIALILLFELLTTRTL
jgi:hypothetical protein